MDYSTCTLPSSKAAQNIQKGGQPAVDNAQPVCYIIRIALAFSGTEQYTNGLTGVDLYQVG